MANEYMDHPDVTPLARAILASGRDVSVTQAHTIAADHIKKDYLGRKAWLDTPKEDREKLMKGELP